MKAGVLQELIDVKKEHYNAILEEVVREIIIVNNRVEASFHFIKYHDCRDREEDFLKTLRSYIFYYCFPRNRYRNKSNSLEAGNLTWEARDKFFNPNDPSNTGELGEISLYFLLESYLNAPQIVSKMSLKTTAGENYKGSDGIHFGIHNNKKCLFYCESKLDKDRSDAFRNCINSILEFHKSKRDFEVSIIRNNIDIQDPQLRKAIIDFLDPTADKKDDWAEINACFVGYDWRKFAEVETETDNHVLHEQLRKRLHSEIGDVKQYLAERIQYPEVKQRFYFFVMPFKDIENLRIKFMELLYGIK